MKKFLESIADFIIEKYKGDFKDLTVILPNRRARLFLEKYLSERTDKSVFAPLFFSIDDFVFKTTGLVKTPATDLVFELYEIYTKLNKTAAQSFDDFSTWGPKLINDFNDIDNYLADSEVIFNYLSEARNLQRWNLDKPELTDLENNYLKFYKSLKTYYKEFTRRLLTQNTAYSGLAKRELIKNLQNTKLPGKNFVIAGFNALTKAEEVLFEHLVANYKADIFWDADTLYISDTKHEAGKHIRKMRRKSLLSGNLIESEGFNKHEKNIKIAGLTGNFPMVKYASRLIEEHENTEDTAIVLPDEELLFPLLNSLPEHVKDMNITMSYPFTKSEYYDLTIRILELYESASRQRRDKDDIVFYYKNLLRFINSPVMRKTFPETGKLIVKQINKENLTLVSFEDLQEFQKNADKKIPFHILEPRDLKARTLLSCISRFLEYLSGEEKGASIEFLHINQKIINRLIAKTDTYNIIENASTLKKLYKTLTGLEGIPFEGRPLAGLQIMGLLETRTLDFKNIIYLSFNEGVIPRNTQFKSFILPEIRREFGLPMPSDDDAITAYHFYRSIQRAENVTLIFNTQPGITGDGEVSRFAAQIKYELSDAPRVNISDEIIKLSEPEKIETKAIEVDKDDEIINRILAYGQNEKGGFSPTSLISYLECGIKFYFSKVLKIKAPKEVEEEIALNTRGNIIHKVLEDLYKEEAAGKKLFDKEFYDRALKEFPAMLDKNYKEIYRRGDTEHGNNLLLKELDYNMIEEFLKAEAKHSQNISDVECEVDFGHFFTVNVNGKNEKIRVFGHADRLDTLNGVKRVIDYKTGKVKNSDVNLMGRNDTESENKWNDMMTKGKHSKAFQLLTYALIHNRSRNYRGDLTALIAGLKTREKYFYLKTEKEHNLSNETLERFEKDLTAVIEEILDKNTPFRQTDDSKVCDNCDFKNICGIV